MPSGRDSGPTVTGAPQLAPPRRAQARRLLPLAGAEALRLVAVTDEPANDLSSWVGQVAAAVRGGATMVQVRAKQTSPRELIEIVRQLVSSLPVPVIVNDRADIAIIAGAAGVHLGAEDLPVEAVRAFAPASFIIGASLGSSAELESAR